MKMAITDFCVVAGAIAGGIFVGGMLVGEYKARQTMATVCEPQPGTVLASSIQGTAGLVCIYVDNLQGRATRRQKAKL